MGTKTSAFTATAGDTYRLKWAIPSNIKVTTVVIRNGQPANIVGGDPAGGNAKPGKVTITVTRDDKPVDFDGDDPKATVDGSNWSFTSTVKSALAGKVVYTIKADAPGTDTRIATGTIAAAPRLRCSIFDFNASLAKGGGPGNWVWDESLFSGLKSARVDDYTMVISLGFDPANPTQPQWIMAPNGDIKNKATNSPAYLTEAATKLRGIGVQLCIGFGMVHGTVKNDVKAKMTPAQLKPVLAQEAVANSFRDFLSGPADKVTQLANNIVAKIKGCGVEGINFDLEIDALGEKQRAGVENLFTTTAAAMAQQSPKGWISYDNAPFTPNDGQGQLGFMNIQPFSLAGKASNIITRPMCYNDSISNEPSTIAKSVDCALAPSPGGGLSPSAVQFGLWGSTMNSSKLKSATTLDKFCKDVLRPKKVGLVVYGGRQLSADLFKQVQGWEAALNPGADAPGKSGQPLQVPRP